MSGFLRVGRRRTLKFKGAPGCLCGDNSVLYCLETPLCESPGMTSFPQLNSLRVALWSESAVFSFPFDQVQSRQAPNLCLGNASRGRLFLSCPWRRTTNSEAGTMAIEGVSGGAHVVVLFPFLNRIHSVTCMFVAARPGLLHTRVMSGNPGSFQSRGRLSPRRTQFGISAATGCEQGKASCRGMKNALA